MLQVLGLIIALRRYVDVGPYMEPLTWFLLGLALVVTLLWMSSLFAMPAEEDSSQVVVCKGFPRFLHAPRLSYDECIAAKPALSRPLKILLSIGPSISEKQTNSLPDKVEVQGGKALSKLHLKISIIMGTIIIHGPAAK